MEEEKFILISRIVGICTFERFLYPSFHVCVIISVKYFILLGICLIYQWNYMECEIPGSEINPESISKI